MSSTSQTVAIVGGAIIGSSIAYFLREQGFAGRIVVIERDPSYARSSTALSAASIRTQFGCPVNVAMSLFGADFFRNLPDRFGAAADIGFIERGYLFLGAAGTADDRRAGAAMQRREGAAISVLQPAAAKARFGFLNVEDVAIATYGERNEGWFDAWALLSLMRRAARDRGVSYVTAHAQGLALDGDRVCGVRLSDGQTIDCDWCVNAAGAASAALVEGIGIDLPISPRKRTVFVVRAPVDGTGFPMLFDTTGFWLRPEGRGFICGIAPDATADPDATDDFEPDHAMLEETLWPALAHRVPAFEKASARPVLGRALRGQRARPQCRHRRASRDKQSPLCDRLFRPRRPARPGDGSRHRRVDHRGPLRHDRPVTARLRPHQDRHAAARDRHLLTARRSPDARSRASAWHRSLVPRSIQSLPHCASGPTSQLFADIRRPRRTCRAADFVRLLE